MRHLEHTALTLDLAQVLLTGHVGHVFAEHEDAFVARHLVAHAGVEQVHHGGGLARELRIVFGIELFRRWIDVGRVHAEHDCIGAGLRLLEGVVGGRENLGVDRVAQYLQFVFGGESFGQQIARERGERITRGIGVTLILRTIEHFVVGERVRVRADHLGVYESRSSALTRIRHGPVERGVRRQKITAVDFFDVEVGERRHELRDRATGGIHFDRHRDRVAVVLHEVHDRQLEIARRVERLPELAFAGRTVTGGHERHVIAWEPVGELALRRPQRGLGVADGLQKLGAGRRGDRHDVEIFLPPVTRHLPTTGVRIDRRTDGAIQHLRRRHPELQAERTISVI